jgi:hypothetical protein
MRGGELFYMYTVHGTYTDKYVHKSAEAEFMNLQCR